jgi:hypothetical protein
MSTTSTYYILNQTRTLLTPPSRPEPFVRLFLRLLLPVMVPNAGFVFVFVRSRSGWRARASAVRRGVGI